MTAARDLPRNIRSGGSAASTSSRIAARVACGSPTSQCPSGTGG
ncbi:Uncharacterised protein [Amycolatopsis camponoti]|uniref:Uncharacterized protein n=1 Tax=Amycolatopsis camponoti TaxID=2606593 RepID=A0A6I8LLF0_9PSEU|nr:Uncharacterised protein [Amycolatopsis camponoti]